MSFLHLELDCRRLHEDDVDVPLFYFGELFVGEFQDTVNLIYAGVVEQKGQLQLVMFVGDHLHDRVDVCHFDGDAAHPGEGIEDDLSPVALIGNVLGQ